MHFFFVDGNAGPPNYSLAQVNQKQNVVVRVTSLSPPRFFTKKKKQTKAFQGLAVLKLSLQQVFCSDQCNLFFFLFLFTGVSRQVELYKLVSKADCGKEKKRYMNLQHRVQQV